MKLLIIKFSPFPCYLVPLGPKYSPQHPILKHPYPTLSDLINRTITLLVSESVGLSVRPVRHYVISYTVRHFVTWLVTQCVRSLVPTYYIQARHHAEITAL
jgi:hypothetical protein